MNIPKEKIHKFPKGHNYWGHPKTEMAKLKKCLSKRGDNPVKPLRNTKIMKLMEEAGVDFSDLERCRKIRNIFEIWLRSKSDEELTEIQRFEGVLHILENDMTVRSMRKLEQNRILDEDDIKLIHLYKDALAASHELKFGKKKINVNASIKDLRDLMFKSSEKKE